jgi:hypothetical protein
MYCTSCGTQLQDIANFAPNAAQDGRARRRRKAPRRLYRWLTTRNLPASAPVCRSIWM